MLRFSPAASCIIQDWSQGSSQYFHAGGFWGFNPKSHKQSWELLSIHSARLQTKSDFQLFAVEDSGTLRMWLVFHEVNEVLVDRLDIPEVLKEVLEDAVEFLSNQHFFRVLWTCRHPSYSKGPHLSSFSKVLGLLIDVQQEVPGVF